MRKCSKYFGVRFKTIYMSLP